MAGTNVKALCISLAFVSVVVFSSCTADKAADLFETAQFEELQNNGEHARQLYKEIIQKYPGSDVALKAAERLHALESEKKSGADQPGHRPGS